MGSFVNKYEPLWQYLKHNDKDEYILSFDQIKSILGFDIDHSFLTYKKTCKQYGYETTKISLKQKTVVFKRIF